MHCPTAYSASDTAPFAPASHREAQALSSGAHFCTHAASAVQRGSLAQIATCVAHAWARALATHASHGSVAPPAGALPHCFIACAAASVQSPHERHANTLPSS